MKMTFLGTGTSNGIPFIACDCPVCTSTNPKNKRLRSSILITHEGKNILIDASADYRQQALIHDIRDLEAILITHVHADHVFGLDEMRRYNQIYKKKISLYCEADADVELRRVFQYMYTHLKQLGGGVSQLENKIIEPGESFFINGLPVTPIRIQHGILPIVGYRVGNIAYLTDCSFIPEESYKLLKDLDVLVVSALRDVKHPTHFSLEEAVAAAQRIGAKQTFFTHIAHSLEHETTNKKLPKNIQLAYDGLEVSA
jgi:phosphoribosyl 1,2-cyclic phosphate phosphodiesterase